MFMYRQNLSALIKGRHKENPFKMLSRQALAEGDILPLIKNAIFMMEKKQSLCYKGKCIPSRLQIDGHLESDEEYLGHFVINGVNIGFESPGLSDITADINTFSLIGKKN